MSLKSKAALAFWFLHAYSLSERVNGSDPKGIDSRAVVKSLDLSALSEN
jgi:hypothetical protein